jgi:Holliday junction resolvase RusA-like endonuclease
MPRVVIQGKPVPKARARKGRNGWYTPTSAHEEWVAMHFVKHRGLYREGRVMVACAFYVNSRSKADSDNLVKLVRDAMQKAGVFTNDVQVQRGWDQIDVVPDGTEHTVVWFGRPEEAGIR